jgi:hypothetical protein
MVKMMAVLMTASLILALAISPANASRHWQAPLTDRSLVGAPAHLVPAGDDNGGGC